MWPNFSYRRSTNLLGHDPIAHSIGFRYGQYTPPNNSLGLVLQVLIQCLQGVTKRAGRKKDAAPEKGRGGTATSGGGGGGRPSVKKAVFESTKKKEVGVSDLTLISKISNEAINDNLKKRFENREIYVRWVEIGSR